MIKTSLTDSLLWPMRKVIPILPGDYRDLELEPMGTLMVKLVQAKNLLNMDTFGKSDPYAIIFVRPIPKQMRKSRTINNELNPIWNEQFQFEVEDLATQKLTIRIFDEDSLHTDDLLGCAQVPLNKLKPGILAEFWLTLVEDLENTMEAKHRGQVHLELLYQPHVEDRRDVSTRSMTSLEREITRTMRQHSVHGSPFSLPPSRPEQHDFVRGVLSIKVLRAENLMKVDSVGANPYVKLLLKKSNQKKTSRVINKNLNPEWNQSFHFLVEDAQHDMLVLEVRSRGTFGKHFLGRCGSTLSKVLLEGEYEASFKLEGVESGQIFLHFNWISMSLQRQPFNNS
ncbi:hypothetical protein O6H91_10G060900 [Diphasiastrum complanatum]|nr:hypothetical protein O6H91_10G060900 [Diphasiastrum complanatum]